MKMAIFYYVTSKLNSFKKFRKIRELLKTFEVKLSRIGPKVSDAKVHYFYTILPTSDEWLNSGGRKYIAEQMVKFSANTF